MFWLVAAIPRDACVLNTPRCLRVYVSMALASVETLYQTAPHQSSSEAPDMSDSNSCSNSSSSDEGGFDEDAAFPPFLHENGDTGAACLGRVVVSCLFLFIYFTFLSAVHGSYAHDRFPNKEEQPYQCHGCHSA